MEKILRWREWANKHIFWRWMTVQDLVLRTWLWFVLVNPNHRTNNCPKYVQKCLHLWITHWQPVANDERYEYGAAICCIVTTRRLAAGAGSGLYIESYFLSKVGSATFWLALIASHQPQAKVIQNSRISPTIQCFLSRNNVFEIFFFLEYFKKTTSWH